MTWIDAGLLQQLPLFMAAVLVLNATPGVDLLLTVTRSAHGGLRAGSGAALGIACGCAGHVLAGAFGLAALLAVSSQAYWVLKWAGAAYLAWLGLGLLWSRRGPPQAPRPPQASAPPASMAADFRRGLLTNLLNPKVAFFLLAFLPQFVPSTTPHKTAAFLFLGAVFVAQSLLFLLVVAALTARLARLPAWRGSGVWLKRAAGLLFLALALRLAWADTDAGR